MPLKFNVIGASLFFGSDVGLKLPLAVSLRLPTWTMMGFSPFAVAIPTTARTSSAAAKNVSVKRLPTEKTYQYRTGSNYLFRVEAKERAAIGRPFFPFSS